MTIPNKKKPCKGIKYARGYGCGEDVFKRTYGLCYKCHSNWLFLDENKEFRDKLLIRNKKKIEKEEKEKTKKQKIELLTLSAAKKTLQKKVNEIVRLIDLGKGCHSCTHGWEGLPFKRKANAGHFHSVGKNDSIRFNLYNIWLQCEQCNQYLSGNEKEYVKGLKKLYGNDLFEFIMYDLPKNYPLMKFDKFQILEASKECNKIINEIKGGKDYTRGEVNRRLKLYK